MQNSSILNIKIENVNVAEKEQKIVIHLRAPTFEIPEVLVMNEICKILIEIVCFR